MKTKIVEALKTEYSNIGLSDKAFDGVASFLEKTITDESQIVTAVKGDDVRGLLKVFQSEADGLRTAKQKALKELEDYKMTHPDNNQPTGEKTEQTSEVASLLRALQEQQAALAKRIDDTESRDNLTRMRNDVVRLMKGKGCSNEYITRNVLRSLTEVSKDDTAESLADKYAALYDNEYKEAYGSGAKPREGSHQVERGYKKGEFADFVDAMVKAGEIPEAKK